MLRAGAASRDITPELKGDFFGYVRPDLRARGVALRLHAHALVLDDGTRTVCLLILDLGAPLITRGVLSRVGDLGYDLSNLIVAATHTHAGPNKPGDWIASQAADAVRAAHEARVPARAGWGRAEVTDANRSRSLEAHLANHGLDLYPGTATDDLDPLGVDHPRELAVRMLRVEDATGRPLAAWGHFAAHPTTYGPANTYFSADYPGAARHHFAAGFDQPPVAMLANGTEGDLITHYDETNQHALADRIGHRVALGMRRAWDEAVPLTDALLVAGASERIRYEGQRLAPGVEVGARAWFGLPFLGGGMNGPSFLYGLGLEGRRRPRALADPVHGRKLVAAPAPWPAHADLTVLRIGEAALLSVPGEPTVETGRHMTAAALAADGDGNQLSDALVVGLAQGYRGYFTTPEEYDQQHYEGGHTVFGKHTSRLVEQAHARLAREVAGVGHLGSGTVDAGGDADDAEHRGPESTATGPRPLPVSAAGSRPVSGPPARSLAPVGKRRPRHRIVEQPPQRIERFETLQLAWTGPRRGRGRPADAPLLTIEREHPDDGWVVVDDDLGIGMVWRQRGRRAVARYEVPGDLPLGHYRCTVHGVDHQAPTRSFEVVASAGLRVLEALPFEGGLLLRAQHPAPDPAASLRRRDRRPRGGQLRALVDGREVVLAFDADRDGWWVTDLADARWVEVAPGGLIDGADNHNGQPAGLEVGAACPPSWPTPMGPGGGRPPALFGLGPAGAPARR